jgi:tRNA C32,U32 (ribose-2'-O)-methylase TrmJ
VNGPAVLLINPKTPYNVGSAIRACSIFGVDTLRWTGKRISTAEGRRMAGSGLKNKPRLPREERLKDYTNVDWREACDQVITDFVELGLVPVAIEVMQSSVPLHVFEHPERALYVFGPEDGTLGGPTLSVCHHFVRIASATRTPLNLAAAVNVVLHDRYVKGVV